MEHSYLNIWNYNTVNLTYYYLFNSQNKFVYLKSAETRLKCTDEVQPLQSESVAKWDWRYSQAQLHIWLAKLQIVGIIESAYASPWILTWVQLPTNEIVYMWHIIDLVNGVWKYITQKKCAKISSKSSLMMSSLALTFALI